MNNLLRVRRKEERERSMRDRNFYKDKLKINKQKLYA